MRLLRESKKFAPWGFLKFFLAAEKFQNNFTGHWVFISTPAVCRLLCNSRILYSNVQAIETYRRL